MDLRPAELCDLWKLNKLCTEKSEVQYHFVRVYHFSAVLLNSGCHLSEVKFACRDLVLLHYCADSLLQLAAFAAVVAIRCSLLYVHYFDTLHE